MKKYHFLQLFAEGEAAPAETSGVTPADAAPEASADLNAEFETLIRGKYKEQYDSRVQDTVRKRLRSSHETVEKFNTLTRALEQENASLRQSAGQNHAIRQVELWKEQAREAKELYPGFDMNAECQNPRFRQLMLSGLDVSSAYLVMHRDELLKNAALSGKQMVVDNIMATGTRPSENGASAQSAAYMKSDVASMTKADREAIRKRAARGERIRF